MLAKAYVAGVLAVAAAGFVAWLLATRDVGRALSTTTAVLIVTCPCAFGIASPLAYEMVQAGLRRAGLFVRRSSFLDRARDVRRIVFDKTGTLTTGALVLENGHALDRLSPEQRQVLYDLVVRSGHPKSAAVREALHRRGLTLEPSAHVVEHPGKGVELVGDGRTWRLGEPAWVAAPRRATGDVAFGVNGVLLAEFVTGERLRPDAAREVGALASDGYDVWLFVGTSSAGSSLPPMPAGSPWGARSAARAHTTRLASSPRTTTPTRSSSVTA